MKSDAPRTVSVSILESITLRARSKSSSKIDKWRDYTFSVTPRESFRLILLRSIDNICRHAGLEFAVDIRDIHAHSKDRRRAAFRRLHVSRRELRLIGDVRYLADL